MWKKKGALLMNRFVIWFAAKAKAEPTLQIYIHDTQCGSMSGIGGERAPDWIECH